MSEYLTSGSGWERLSLCPASVALPHANYESIYSARGTAIHAFLEALTTMPRDEALRLVDADWRSTCEALELEGLDAQLALAAEVALAYHFEHRTARELGRGVGRKYDDVGIDELPTTLDIVGVRVLPSGVRRGVVIDWKTGWTTRRKIDRVVQLKIGALVAARAFQLDVVEVQLVHVFEDERPWVQREVFEGWEIDVIEAEAIELYRRARAMRELMLQGVVPDRFETGPWCDTCPSREFCPAQTSLIRSVLSLDDVDGEMRMGKLDDRALAQLWGKIHSAKSALRNLEGKVRGVAGSRPILLRTEDGQDVWLGAVPEEGNEKLDGEVAYDAVSEMFSDPVWRTTIGLPAHPMAPDQEPDAIAAAATKVTTSKKDLEAAIKAHVPRGKAATAMREAIKRIADAGGSHRRWSTKVKEFRTVLSSPPADRALPPADPPSPPGDDEP